MYVILRETDVPEKPELCFVQAKSAEKAKEMVGVKESETKWNILITDLLNGFLTVKEGYFVIQI